MSRFRIEILAKDHDRSRFDCGSPPLNRYLTSQVGQDVRRRVTACFVAIENSTGTLAGYYTLSAGSVALSELPDTTARKLPRYPTVPIARMGRLAVDLNFQGQKLGSVLLFDAMKRSVQSEIAVFAVVVDAKDDAAAGYYEQFGFERFASHPNGLFLPLSAAMKQLTAP